MAQVVNPIYDTVFKYLMQDEKVAKVLIGNILKTKVVSIQMNNNEYSAMLPDGKKMFKLDFSATILTRSGKHQLVHIEVQKALEEGEIMRFRSYLGAIYMDQTKKYLETVKDAQTKTETTVEHPLPIHSICMCRTERISVMDSTDYIDDSSKTKYLEINENDINSYRETIGLINKTEVKAKFTVDFVKSAPYILSFMQKFGGVYRGSEGFSKTLIFSSWEIQDVDWYWAAPQLLDNVNYGLYPDNNTLRNMVYYNNVKLGRQPADLADVLSYMVLGSPAVCLYRAHGDMYWAHNIAVEFVKYMLLRSIILSLYRLTLGQPRQEELLEYVFREFGDADREVLKNLFINLSPYSHDNN